MARKDEFSCSGLGTFTIAGVVIMSVGIFLRMLSRRLSGAKYTADDWTLVVAWVCVYAPWRPSMHNIMLIPTVQVLTTCAEAMYLCNFYNGKVCYHSLVVPDEYNEYQGRVRSLS